MHEKLLQKFMIDLLSMGVGYRKTAKENPVVIKQNVKQIWLPPPYHP